MRQGIPGPIFYRSYENPIHQDGKISSTHRPLICVDGKIGLDKNLKIHPIDCHKVMAMPDDAQIPFSYFALLPSLFQNLSGYGRTFKALVLSFPGTVF